MGDIDGWFTFYLWAALLFTFPASYVAVTWYRRIVGRQMARFVRADLSVAGAQDVSIDRQCVIDPRRLRAARRRLVIAYAVAALASAAVLSFLFLRDLPEVRAVQIFLSLFTYAWPVVVVLPVALALRPRQGVNLAFGYVAGGAIVVAAWAAVGRYLLGHVDATPPARAAGVLLQLLFMSAWMGALFIAVTGHRRWRAVSPMVLAALLLFTVGTVVVRLVIERSLDQRAWTGLIRVFGDPKTPWLLLGALPVGAACWLLLRWIARRFERKATSDVGLLIDSWWLIACVAMAPPLSESLRLPGLSGLLAFIAYRAVLALMLTLLPLAEAPGSAPRLLLLRVFGHRGRSEALFDDVVQTWRFAGPVNLLAGVDLATRSLDPADIITFFGGDVHELFVHDRADLERRVAAFDERCDPDGRYRVNELHCHIDGWRPALQSLLARSDVVLMDLRGFSAANEGCRFELESLGALERTSSTLFVVDEATDLALARELLRAPSAGAGPSLNFMRVDRRSARQRIVRSLEALAVG